MQLIILGSGAALPSIKRSAPSYLLKIGNDLVLLDAGPGTLRQFEKIKIDYFDLTQILISHPHADHIADLIPILQSSFVRTLELAGGAKREKPLILIGPPKFKKFYRNLREPMMPEKEPYQIKLYEMGNSAKKFKNWHIETIITRHVDFFKSISFKIYSQDTIFVYSGDTAFCPEIIEFCKGAGTLLLDCAIPLSEEFPGSHLNPELASEIACLSGAKTLILTHLYDLDTPEEIKKEVAKKFKGKIIIAKDLAKIIL